MSKVAGSNPVRSTKKYNRELGEANHVIVEGSIPKAVTSQEGKMTFLGIDNRSMIEKMIDKACNYDNGQVKDLNDGRMRKA